MSRRNEKPTNPVIFNSKHSEASLLSNSWIQCLAAGLSNSWIKCLEAEKKEAECLEERREKKKEKKWV